MVLKTDRNLKLYYSIKEVSDIIGVNESTLRYWETELPQLKPRTATGSKVRQYTDRDIDLLKNIYTLVKVRGFKIAAARKMINENREGANRSTHVLIRFSRLGTICARSKKSSMDWCDTIWRVD